MDACRPAAVKALDLAQDTPGVTTVIITSSPPAATGTVRGAQAQLLRPFPQFGDVTMLGASGGNSFYNAATIKAQKRFSRGFSLLAAYTFSKLLDNITGNGNYFAPDNTANVINAYDRSGDYGLSSVDTPHRYTLSGAYELPFGRGRTLMSSASYRAPTPTSTRRTWPCWTRPGREAYRL